jgi:hypothetical protein
VSREKIERTIFGTEYFLTRRKRADAAIKPQRRRGERKELDARWEVKTDVRGSDVDKNAPN